MSKLISDLSNTFDPHKQEPDDLHCCYEQKHVFCAQCDKKLCEEEDKIDYSIGEPLCEDCLGSCD